MAKLIFLLDGNVIQEYPLDKARMTIGRRATNDIHIDNLAISGEHAAIVIDGDDIYIEDLNSTNGTLVNQKRVAKQSLSHGDEIGLGKYSLKYIKDGLNHAPADGFIDTVTVATESKVAEDIEATPVADEAPAQPAPSDEALPQEVSSDVGTAVDVEEGEEQPASEATEALSEEEPVDEEGVLTPRLQILNGDNAGNALLLDKSMVKIGQPGEQVAVVTKRQEGYFLTHVAGENYPLINGKTIGSHAHALNNYDVIEVMDDKMEFRLD